jgi:hypothetical protein
VKESRKVMVLSSENVTPLPTHSAPGSNELQRFEWKAPCDEQDDLEILRRALVEQTDETWLALQRCFSQTVCRWIRSHPYQDVALLRDSEENYIAQTFSRFWYAVRDQHVEFTTLAAALRYLHSTLNGIMLDTVRFHLRLRSWEMPFPESGCSSEPLAATPMDSQGIWESIQSLLSDERERRLAYLLYHCGLKPRDIVRRCSPEFPDVQEIYRLTSNILVMYEQHFRNNSDDGPGMTPCLLPRAVQTANPDSSGTTSHYIGNPSDDTGIPAQVCLRQVTRARRQTRQVRSLSCES